MPHRPTSAIWTTFSYVDEYIGRWPCTVWPSASSTLTGLASTSVPAPYMSAPVWVGVRLPIATSWLIHQIPSHR